MSYNSDSISHQVNEFHGLNAVQFLRRGVSFSRKLGMNNWISQPVSHIHGRALPEPAIPVGYAALIERFGLSVPVPPRLAAIAERHHPVSNQSWNLLTPRHRPPNTLEGQIVFALKWEGLDLGVLGALFKVVKPEEISELVRATPTGSFARRIWFLYEWLTGRELDVPDPGKVRLVNVVDTEQQVGLNKGTASPRHKVIDNLPGTRRFCPMIGWTQALRAAVAKGLDVRAREIIGRTRKDLISRAAAFLLLSDSKSSFAIEGERPSSVRAARWARAIGEAGVRPVTIDELERLQRVVIGDARFVKLGVRNEGGFVGTHDRETQEPVPEHISARPQDVRDLLGGIIEYDGRSLTGGVDAVSAAAAIAFGFVYIHPFVDGNGRLHRWLIHHVLARGGFNPPGVVFPVSAVILRKIDVYRKVLESYSRPLLSLINWRPTLEGNVEVLNETADYYRYFDATRHAEFLYGCVAETVEQDLPNEVKYLAAYDRFASRIQSLFDVPNSKLDLLWRFLQQNEGKFSRRARAKEFSQLTDEEAAQVENAFDEVWSTGSL